MTSGGGYALGLDDEEHARLRAQAASARDREEQLWPRLGIGPGAKVADLGCGPAATLLGLTSSVGPSGSLVGIDSNPEAVARARQDITAAGAETVAVHEGSAWDSGLEPGSFDAVIVRLVLVHNGGREQDIVDHAVSLVRPGGRVCLVDNDMTMIRVSPPTAPATELFERLERFERGRGQDVAVGLRLADLLAEADATVVDYYGDCSVRRRAIGQRGPAWAAREAMVAAGEATADDVARWDAEFTGLDQQELQPWYISCGFTAIGERRT